MPKYRWTGPYPATFSLVDHDGKTVVLEPGEITDLPDDVDVPGLEPVGNAKTAPAAPAQAAPMTATAKANAARSAAAVTAAEAEAAKAAADLHAAENA